MLNQPVTGSGDLYTTVRNMNTQDTFFGFLPPHGRTLGGGEEFSFFGSIDGYLNRRVVRDRSRRSLENALRTGDIVIVKTPAVLVYDPVLDLTKALALSNGTYIKNDPSWGRYSSSMQGPAGLHHH